MISASIAKRIGSDRFQRANAFLWKRILSTKPRKIVAGTLVIVPAAEFSYRVRELLAALLIFTVAFVAVAVILVILSAFSEGAHKALFYIYQRIVQARPKSSPNLARQSHYIGSSPILYSSVERETSQRSLAARAKAASRTARAA